MGSSARRADNNSAGFGTFAGVLTPSLLTIFGVVLFMRASFVVGEAGVFGALLILVVGEVIILLTSLSICAISTNMKIRGGGAYFMISRVLGPNYGGTIGLTLYVSQSLVVVFGVIGFTEALYSTYPSIDKGLFLPIALGTLCALVTIVYAGAKWATKAQFLILILLGFSIFFMLGGAAVRFDLGRFQANLMPPAMHTPVDNDLEKQKKVNIQLNKLVDDIQSESDFLAKSELLRYIEYLQDKGTYTFWMLFAIYFPAVTGILTGVNMSGDLKDPAKSITRGTLISLVIGFVIYGLQIILSGGAYDRNSMIDHPFGTLRDNALLGMGFLIFAGMACSSLSSSLGDLMGSPRVLQAVARDRILPVIDIFKKGSAKRDEPRNALVFTFIFQVAVIIAIVVSGGTGSALNLIATVVTMFYLWTYGMINVAAFVERASNNPSFRPKFRYFHWGTALLGAVSCVFAAVMINFTAAIIATLIVLIIQGLLKRRRLEAAFGNSLRGYYFEKVRENLIHLLHIPEDNVNWRPTIFVLIGRQEKWETLITYATWLDNARGIVRTGNVITGDVESMGDERRKRINEIAEYTDQLGLSVFPMVAVAPNVPDGLSILFQAESVRPIRRNVALFGWGPSVRSFISRVHWAVHDDLSFLAIKADCLPDAEKKKRIDLWWTDIHGSSLSLLMGHLLGRNWEWHHSSLRVLVPVEDAETAAPAIREVEQCILKSRIDAEVVPVAAAGTRKEILEKYSGDSDCVFLNVGLPSADGDIDSWYKNLDDEIEGLSTVILVHSTVKLDILV